MNRDDEGKLEVIYKNRWEGILGVVLGSRGRTRLTPSPSREACEL